MEVLRSGSLAEALEILAGRPSAVPLAGGTDLMVAINFGRERPAAVLPIAGLAELGTIEKNGSIRCGAAVTFSRVLAELAGLEPGLVQAARTVGSPQIRNAATLGGNLGTCSPAGDALPVLAALDAAVIVRSQTGGERRLGLDRYMRGPKQTDLRPGELVVGVEWRPAGPAQAYMKAGTRNAMVIAVASLALVVDRRRRRVGVALGSVGPTVIRAAAAEAFAAGLLDEAGWERPLTASAAAGRRFGELAAAAAAPIDDVRGSAAYRRHIVFVMAARALARAGAVA